MTGYAESHARLRAVQARVRELAKRPWLAEALRSGFEDFVALEDRYRMKSHGMRQRELSLARVVLAGGHLNDRTMEPHSACLPVTIMNQPCPVALAKRLSEEMSGDMPEKLEREAAAAALRALDRHIALHSRELAESQRESMHADLRSMIDDGTHVAFQWRVWVAKPSDWPSGVNPNSIGVDELKALPASDLRTVALFRLGGLADTDSIQPIVPEPISTGDMVRDVLVSMTWDQRSVPFDQDPEAHLPPDIAEQMLALIESWVRDAESGGGTDATPSMRLARAMQGVHESCGQSHQFRDLALRRAEAHAARVRLLNAYSSARFATLDAMLAAQSEVDGWAELIPPAEPPEYLLALQRILDDGRAWCEVARKALRDGGAAVLDAALAQGTCARSVEVGVKVREAESLFMALHVGLGDPRVVVGADAERLGALAEWFGRARNELDAVLAVSGAKDVDGKPRAARKAGKGESSPRQSQRPADKVRLLLSGDQPFEGSKTELAQQVGYTHQSSLARVKNFLVLWDENERKVAMMRAQRERRMDADRNR